MSELDARKQLLIEEFQKLSKGKKKDDILPLILAFSEKAKQSGIHFSNEDILTVLDSFKDNMTEQERQLLPGLLKAMGL